MAGHRAYQGRSFQSLGLACEECNEVIYGHGHPLFAWVAYAMSFVADYSYSGVVVAALNLCLCCPRAEVDSAGVFAFHDDALPHVSESCDVAFVFCPGFDAPVDAVVHVFGKVVSDLPLEA